MEAHEVKQLTSYEFMEVTGLSVFKCITDSLWSVLYKRPDFYVYVTNEMVSWLGLQKKHMMEASNARYFEQLRETTDQVMSIPVEAYVEPSNYKHILLRPMDISNYKHILLRPMDFQSGPMSKSLGDHHKIEQLEGNIYKFVNDYYLNKLLKDLEMDNKQQCVMVVSGHTTDSYIRPKNILPTVLEQPTIVRCKLIKRLSPWQLGHRMQT